MKINLVTRYLARWIYLYTGVVVFALGSLAFFFDFIREIGYLNNNYKLNQALFVVMLGRPGQIYETFPIAVMLGTLYALTFLARRSELIVMRTSGMSLLHLVGILSLISMPLITVHLVMGEVLAPYFADKTAQYKEGILGAKVAEKANYWVRLDPYFIGIHQILPPAQLEGVRIFELDKQNRLLSIQEAQSGVYVSPAQWLLKGVVRIEFDPAHTTQTQTRRFDEMLWTVKLNPDSLRVLSVVPEKMGVLQLWDYIRFLEDNKLNAHRYRVAIGRKIVFPFSIWVMMIMMMPFVLSQETVRSGRFLVLQAMMIGIAFYTFDALVPMMGIANKWPVLPSLLAPSLIATCAVMLRLRRLA